MSMRVKRCSRIKLQNCFTPAPGRILQRKCACGGTPCPIGECEACRKKRQSGTLQRATDYISRSTHTPIVPPIVHDVLRSPGQPLDRATRDLMESHFNRNYNDIPSRPMAVSQQSLGSLTIRLANDPLEQEAQRAAGKIAQTTAPKSSPSRFGHDFAQVRVHTDGRAAESALAVDALAYTVGHDIVFGVGRYAPQSPTGQSLLAHELSHVTQQGIGAPSLQRTPIEYDTTAFTLASPKRTFTLVDAKNIVEQLKTGKPPDLTSAGVKGAAMGSDEEIFLWFIAGQVGRRDRWGTELDLVTPIGWAAKPTDPAPVGKVTVTIDTAGNVVAELISKGAVAVPMTFTKLEDAKTALQATYKIADVKDGDEAWSLADLNKVAGAFALLPASDRAALQGVVLLRVSTINGGSVAGEFGSSQSLDAPGTTAISEATLRLANSAFASDTQSFVGSKTNASPASYRTIVHEVGHAVATKAKRDADVAQIEAVAKSNRLVEPQNTAVTEANAAIDAEQTLIDEYNVLVTTYNDTLKTSDASQIAAAKKDLDSKKKEVDAKKLEVANLQKVEATKRAALEAAKKEVKDKKKLADATRISDVALTLEKTSADAAKARSDRALTVAKSIAATFKPKDDADSASYRQAIEDAHVAIEDYVTSAAAAPVELDALEATVLAVLNARNNKRDSLKSALPANPALTTFGSVETAQDTWFRAAVGYARAKERPRRIQRFVDFVNSKKITPFTMYARDNWPHKPGEFYAEAYSLWRTDPDYLKVNAKALFDWFQTGEYLK
jgi:Domain of unknown function (DUF4157)